jgi:lipopolysaccharide export system permease protein
LKTLHFYLIRQVLATLTLAVAIFTFVLLLGNAVKGILTLLINHQATVAGIVEAFLLLIPFVLVFALPMAMLASVLLVFGRFSADQELTAARSSGVSLLALVTPVLVLSLGLCAISAAVNLEIAPRCLVAYRNLTLRMSAKLVTAAIPEGRPIRDFPGYVLIVGRVDGTNLSGIYASKWDPAQNKAVAMAYAPSGTLELTNEQITVRLRDIVGLEWDGKKWRPGHAESFNSTFTTKELARPAAKVELNDMTFRQLQAELKTLDQFILEKPGAAPELPADTAKPAPLAGSDPGRLRNTILQQMHRQVSASFACLAFTLVGIPLGIRTQRRETNTGVALALLLALLYYSLVILGQSMNAHSQDLAYLVIWLPNFVFQAAGIVLLARANRGF